MNATLRRLSQLDVGALRDELRKAVEGEVRFDPGTRAIYSTDASNYRQLPIGVVVPKTIDDVLATVEVCRSHGAPVLSRGGGTSLAGQCCNTAVVVDFSKHLNRILGLDRERKLARVQPGAILDDLRNLGESTHPRVTFGPTPSTHDHCTIGGMIGNNACGNYSIMSEFFGAGPRMAHNVAEMEVLTYDGTRLKVGSTADDEFDRIVATGGRRGEIYGALRGLRDRYAELIRKRFPEFPRRVSGYNLDGLLPERGFDLAYALVGTEGTCVTVLEATLHMVESPPARSLVLVGFADIYAAAAQMLEAREHKPIALEGFDQVLVENNKKLGLHAGELRMLPEGGGWMLAEFAAETKKASDAKALKLLKAMRKAPGFTGEKLYDDPEAEARIWEVRESGLGATAFVPGEPDTYEGWEDSAVPPENLAGYLRDLRKLFSGYGYACALYGHFGQGCVHTRIDWDPHTERGIQRFRSFLDEATDLVLSYGGSLSGEHGDGQSRAEFLPKMFGPEIVRAFEEFKAIWDPDGAMNPGKVVRAYRQDQNLRLGPDYRPPPVNLHFSYPEDHGSFAHAANRCVGVGKCRHMGGGTMCPSFMVTREEEHSTRGRARALFEMMSGKGELALWKSDEVLGALDLCLSCKGCKKECPVGVDMATYKAEFLSHYYKGKPRPRVAYAMGLIGRWARLASFAPGAANLITHTATASGLVKRLAGIAPERPVPSFASQTFRSWYARRGSRARPGSPPVLLWPDTFVNYFHPTVGKATVEVLERAGYEVRLPSRALCCGRPLYDYGMLDTAKRWLRTILRTLRKDIRGGVTVIGMEPSCLAVFRDELANLLPDDADAARLARQSVMLSEFLEQRGWDAPKLDRKAIVQAHCHHKAVMGFEPDRRMLENLSLDFEVPDSGCCGLAGSFGFEAGKKYEVSMQAGERVLFPRVRAASAETLIVADGFSCRTQIEHGTGRQAMHIAEVIHMAMREESVR